jgi:hypothetical protein
MTGARYSITIDGTTRTNRDVWEIAVEAANTLKQANRTARLLSAIRQGW